LAGTSKIGEGPKLEGMGRDNALLPTTNGMEYLAAEDPGLLKAIGIGRKQANVTMVMVFTMTQEGHKSGLNVRKAASAAPSTCMAA